MEFAMKFHSGTRKDKQTPEFAHQLDLVQLLTSLQNNFLYKEETIATAFLHDTCEDYDIGFEEIQSKFGEKISESVSLLTKKYRGSKTDPKTYFDVIAKNPIASLVKGADRISNIQTIPLVFSKEKQIEYIKETNEFILPMLKIARKNFPEQHESYQNLSIVLKSQIKLIEVIHSNNVG
jgi:(p)ppGpp synthase/HD superfamily hydrolase